MATPIVTTVPLNNINSNMATNALRPFFAQSGSHPGGLVLGTAGDDASILLQGFGSQVAAAHQMLKLVDVARAEVDQIAVVKLEHASAVGVAKMMGRLLSVNGATGPIAPALRAVADDASNVLVLNGSREQVQQAKMLAASLDVPASGKPREQKLVERVASLEAKIARLEKLLANKGK